MVYNRYMMAYGGTVVVREDYLEAVVDLAGFGRFSIGFSLLSIGWREVRNGL